MKNLSKKLAFLLLSALFAFTSCETADKTNDTTVVVEFSADSVLFVDSKSQTVSFPFTSNVGWKVSIVDSWVSVTPSSGSAGASLSLTLTLEENSSTETRSTYATITASAYTDYSHTFRIVQSGSSAEGEGDESSETPDQPDSSYTDDPITLQVTPSLQTVTAKAGEFTAQITSNSTWTVLSIDSWLTLSSLNGEKDASLTVTYTENSSNTSRSGMIVFASDNLTDTLQVTQEGAELDAPTLTIDSTSYTTDYLSGMFIIGVTSNSTWEITDLPTWITANPTSGNGNGSVLLQFTQNDTNSSRTATIYFVSGELKEAFTLTQAADSSTEPPVSTTDNEVSYTTTSSFSSGDQIAVTAYDNLGTSVASSVIYSYNGSKFESTTPIEFSSTNTSQLLTHYAVYPHTSTGTTFAFTAAADQSTTASYNGSNLQFATVSQSDSRTPQLAFTSQMAKIAFTISSSTVDLSTITASTELQNMVWCDITAGSTTAIGSKTTITPCQRAASSSSTTFEVWVAPQTIADNQLLISVTVAGTSYTLNSSETATLASGSTTSYKLELTSTQLSFYSDINPWGDGGIIE